MSFELVMLAAFAALSVGIPAGAGPIIGRVMSLDSRNKWVVSPDPKNVGKREKWWTAPRPDAKPVRVPGTMQETLGEYHGVAWYWRTLAIPRNPHPKGRCVLRFWSIDYYADLWVNGHYVGNHECADAMFELDITEAVKPDARAGTGVSGTSSRNTIAVRVINPSNEPIEGFRIGETPGRNRVDPWPTACCYNSGGIQDSVELLITSPVRVENLYVKPNWKTGVIEAEVNVRNALAKTVRGCISLSVAPAAGGDALDHATFVKDLKPGDTLVKARVKVDDPRLWNPGDPNLYTVSASVGYGGSNSLDQKSTTCGFRELRFDDGYYRLNDKRIYLKSAHFGGDSPAACPVPFDPDIVRKDFLNLKAMGFNMARCIAGLGRRHIMDLADEIGLMVYDECYASWCLNPSPKMPERYDKSVAGMIVRDRNHPCVVLWGLLNETQDGPVFRHAVASLKFVKSLDDTRVVMLNSGGWDGRNIGSLSNPGSKDWEDLLADKHPYQQCPHTAPIINTLRTIDGGAKPLFLSEYGFGSANNLFHLLGHYDQLNVGYVYDRRALDGLFQKFADDWNRWNLADTFGNMENYFRKCIAMEAEGRLLGTSAIRSNPNVISHSLTACHDTVLAAEGLITSFREPKPGVHDAMFDAWSPLRFCVFAEPVQLYKGGTVHVEAVLVNEDVLKPGSCPVRVQVIGPGGYRALDTDATVEIPAATTRPEPPFAKLVFARDVKLDGPAGEYRLFAFFEKGAAAEGGEYTFWVDDASAMPAISSTITLWGDDKDLAAWLASRGIKTRPFDAGGTGREVIVVGNAAGDFDELTRHIQRGSVAIFLSPSVFARGDNPTALLPLANKGSIVVVNDWLYNNNDWAKEHPIFAGLPKGLLDYQFYREILGNHFWSGQDVPDEIVSGMINTSLGYQSGLTVCAYKLGDGKLLLNSLLVRENISATGSHPVAERLLRNMLVWAEAGPR